MSGYQNLGTLEQEAQEVRCDTRDSRIQIYYAGSRTKYLSSETPNPVSE